MFDKDNKFGFIINNNESNNNIEGLDKVKTDINNIKDEVNEINAQYKDIANLTKNKYFVGKNYPYKTITAAINKWKQDNTPIAEIHIAEGEYNDIISIDPEKSISFIGAGKILTTWRTTSGHYKDAPLTARGGNIIVKNMTIIADHSDSGDSYDYIGNPDETGTGKYQNAYALHFDSGNGGNYFVKNCDLISYQDAALGCGTVNNTTIRVEDTNIFSYTDSNTTHPNADESLNHGGLLYHTYADKGTPTSNENLELINVNIYSKNSPYPFIYKNYSTDGSNKNLFCKNVCVSGDNCTDLFLASSTNGSSKPYYDLNAQSFGNNSLELNYINAINIGVDSNGYCEAVDDCNNLTRCGFYNCKTNTPSSANYMIQNIILNKGYVRQIAYHSSNSKTYQRVQINGVWSSWELKTDTVTSIQSMISVSDNGRTIQVDSIDNISVSGYYLCTKTDSSAPTQAFYIIHCIVANSTASIQEAYAILSNDKYRRYKTSSTAWSEWTKVN